MRKRIFLRAWVAFVLLWMPMGIAFAQTGKGKPTVTMEFKNESLPSVFKRLERVSVYKVLFSYQDVENFKATGILKGASIDKAMQTILGGHPLTYQVDGHFVNVTKGKTKGKQSLHTVRGMVVSSKDGGPLIGAVVYVLGTNNKAFVDEQGHFELNDVESGKMLRVAYLGCKSKTIAAKSQVYVSLDDEENTIGEVVVTGYGNTVKGNFTGAANSVKVDDILMAGASTIDQMLQGQVPGMLVQQETGMVGASSKIRVRGTSSLLGSQEPVWVVDGVVQRDPQPFNSEDNTKFSVDADDITKLAGNAISWLNPNDIESITVLKDASATAIYGSEAANGVIVVTTKKAQAGKVSISYSGDFSIGQRPSYGLYDRMNSNEMMQFSKELYEDRVSYPSNILNVGYAGLLHSYLNKEISKEEFDAGYMKMANQNTDWFSELFRNSFSHKHTVSISGGSDKILNRTSIGYNNEQGDAIGNSSTLFSAISNSTINLFNKKLIVNVNLKGSARKVNGFAYGVNPFEYAYNTSRVIPMYNEDGSLYYHEKWSDEESTVVHGKKSYLYNIKNEIANTGSESNTKTWGATVDLKWKIVPHLEYQGLLSYSSSSTDTKQYASDKSFYVSSLRGYDYGEFSNSSKEIGYSRLPFGGLLETGLSDISNLTVRNALVYDNLFTEKHRLVGQVGIESNAVKTKGNKISRYGYLYNRGETFAKLPLTYYDYVMDETKDNDLAYGSAEIINRASNKLSEYFSLAYTYDDRYVVNFNGRMDASNRFGQDKNHKFEPTWSVGAKWRLASEKWMQPQSIVNNFDIYASFGYQGNAVEAVSPFLIAKDGGVNEYYNDYVLTIKSLPYSDLGWEKTKTYNFGLDATFLKGRLNFTFNYFKKISDVLSSRHIPIENGMENSVVDGGEMTNSGYDFVITVLPIRTKDFTWQVSLNTSVTNNAVNKNQRINTLSDYLDGSAVVDGKPFSTFYSYKFKGLNPEDGTPMFENMDVENAESPLAYLVESGKYTPDFSGGLNMMFKYKNWSLYTLFSVQWGGHSRLPNLYDMSSNYGIPTPEQNVSTDLIGRWRKPGDVTDVPSIPSSSAYINLPNTAQVASSEANLYDMYNHSDVRVANTDFIRCRSISLSYDFPSNVISCLGLSRLTLKGSMTNPFLWARDKKWKGIDPETGNWPTRRITSLSIQAMF